MGRTRQLAGSMAALGLWAAAGCTGSNGATPSTPPTIAPTTTVAPPDTDGRLRMGLLLPKPGDSPLGEGVAEAARQARHAVNEAGGVNGERISLVEADETTSAADNRRAVQTLLDARVDVVIGPTSSLTALDGLDTLVEAGVLTCSPTASARLLDSFPDEGLFFRTVPSDTLQAEAIAEEAERTGARDAAVAYIDDAYGRGLGEAVSQALAARSIPVAPSAFSPTDSNLRGDAARLLESTPDVVAVLGDDVGGPRILAAMGQVVGNDAELPVPDVVVNDAVRRPESPDLISELPDELRMSIVGVSPLGKPTRGSEPLGSFATNAFDCVTATALAAEEADSDRPIDIAARMQTVTSAGSVCANFATCQALIGASRNIDYDGPGGIVELDANGDPATARFDVFTFTAKGVDESVRPIIVSSELSTAALDPPA